MAHVVSLGRSGPKKQLSCEACRKRKIRCERPEDNVAKASPDHGHPASDEAGPSSLNSQSKPGPSRPLPACTPCITAALDCVTIYERKKRGPPGSLSRRSLSTSTPLIDVSGLSPPSRSPQTPLAVRSPIGPEDLASTRIPKRSSEMRTFELPWSPHEASHVDHSSPLSQVPLTGLHRTSAGAMQDHQALVASWQPSPPITGAASSQSPYAVGNPGLKAATAAAAFGDQVPHNTSHSGAMLPPVSAPNFDTRRLVLEDTLPRDTAVYIISLFFDYVHCLIPILHRPTFFERISRRDDQLDPLFYALVMSVVATSLVHVPKALLPVNDEPPIALASRCMRASRIVSVDLYDPPSVDMITIRYFDSVFYSLTGKKGGWVTALSEVRGLAIQLQLHREASYAGLNPVDTEIRRRIFITAFMVDKSAACMQDQLIMIRGEDCDATYFQDLDDEYITPTQYCQQPPDTTSKMAGHRVIAQILTIIGEILELRRSVARQRYSNNPTTVLGQLRQFDNLEQRLVGIYNDLPGPLRLDSAATPVQYDMWVADNVQSTNSQPWEMQALTDLNAYFRSLVDPAPAPAANEAFLVMQGNIHVTRAIARLTLITGREEAVQYSGNPGSAGRSAAERVLSYSYMAHDRRDTVVTDLLYALKRIPVEALAVNSHSLVNKVRFVAVTLLDSVFTPAGETLQDGSDAQKNQEALMAFLGILSSIEQRLVDDHHTA